jgi:hypothetical protein
MIIGLEGIVVLALGCRDKLAVCTVSMALETTCCCEVGSTVAARIGDAMHHGVQSWRSIDLVKS